ncbi:PASTA domain-containing protein [Kribbella sp. VKM Ac-2571]|uniref:PASTA domain-containing protein n=1 Tax=Kribbella sp. VKM Ac-2571 TaxID=2512222 RepID=UPI001061B7D7|nr:PASTA domain-containing protein [Kribbella sp. VKM Ac-2571]TDO68164.1 PASTA domain-containing protein [Kribbella sp. VKM Ac-2571]
MTDLTELLARTADQTPVGPPPLDALHAGATRRRRRRTAGLTGTAVVAVAAVIGGTTLLTSRDQTAPVTTPTPTPSAPATRLVGFGHAAIAVPADWPTNKSSCGTPHQDTLLLDDPSEMLLCMAYRPPGVESVAVYYGRPRVDFHPDETLEIDGVRAERQRTSCSPSNYPKANVTMCVSTVRIPSLDVWFRAESSTSAGEVDRMLSWIHIVPNRTGVPSYWSAAVAPQGAVWKNYAPRLAAAGLKAEFKRVKSPSYPSGTILGVSPAPGAMLPVGSTVTVTVAR